MRLRALCVLFGSLAALGCTSQEHAEVVIYTSVDQVFSEPIFRAFERESGIAVRAVFDTEETKSTGVLNRLIAERAHARADVFWSGDPVRPFLLIERGLVQPYHSPSAATLPPSLRPASGLWTGIAARARVLLVNKTRLSGEPPRSVRELAAPRFRGQAAIANPLFGTTTMHIAALCAALGEPEVKALLAQLKANEIRIASSNGEVKRLVVSGEVTIGLTDTDDAQEALASGAPVEIVYPDQDADELGALVMPTTVVLMRGAPHAQQGRRLIDFLLSAQVERRLAESGAHMPVRPGAAVQTGTRSVAELRAMNVDYAKVAAQMTRMEPWLRAWTGL